MRKYDSYKDSGIEWIGEIPSHWNTYKVKNLINKSLYYQVGDGDHGSIKPEMYQDSGIPYIRVQNLSWSGRLLLDNVVFISEDVQRNNLKSKLIPNDILIAKTGATVGKLGLITNEIAEANTTSSVGKLTVDTKRFDAKYILYSFQSDFFQKELWLKSIEKSAQPGFNIDDFVLFKVVAPEIKEQTTIANYLDKMTTQIDDLIAKKERLIQLLEEERTAIINRAVTKGLDPNVPMKDSGIEWLGETPEHWELWKISHSFKRIGSGTTPESGNPLYHENGTINWLNTGDLNDGEVVSCNKKITEQAMIDYTSLKLFPAGSLVMAMYGATIGKTGIIKFDTTTNQACCVFCEGDIIDLKFLQYWFLAKKENIINLAIGGGQPNISQNILKDIRVNCPSMSEQLNIVKYLDLRTNEVDLIVSKANQEIELIKEYKTALISEVVTGKVDVRN